MAMLSEQNEQTIRDAKGIFLFHFTLGCGSATILGGGAAMTQCCVHVLRLCSVARVLTTTFFFAVIPMMPAQLSKKPF